MLRHSETPHFHSSELYFNNPACLHVADYLCTLPGALVHWQVWHGGQHNVLLGHARLKDAPGDEKSERKDDDAESEDGACLGTDHHLSFGSRSVHKLLFLLGSSFNRMLKTHARFADPFVKPAVVWSRSSKEICVLGLDGCLSFFSVAEEPDVPVYAGVGKLQ